MLWWYGKEQWTYIPNAFREVFEALTICKFNALLGYQLGFNIGNADRSLQTTFSILC